MEKQRDARYEQERHIREQEWQQRQQVEEQRQQREDQRHREFLAALFHRGDRA